MSFYGIRKIWHTALYQGAGKQKRYFEGWYFKQVSREGRVYAVIPGISISGDGGTRHAFIQTIDGNSAETHYCTFPFEDFSFRKDRFDVSIGPNRFSSEGIQVSLDQEGFQFNAALSYGNMQPFPFSLFNPDAMGWYSFMPFMECYHGLVSMDHQVDGTIVVDGQPVLFDAGRGYIEKDWGRSFPSSWVWMQSNEFSNRGDSFMLSVARVPWMGSYIVGFLGFLLVSGKVHKFATYTGAALKQVAIGESEVQIEINAGKYSLLIQGNKQKKGILQAPVNGVMERRITESIDAVIQVELIGKRGNVLFADKGVHGGLEIVGDPKELLG